MAIKIFLFVFCVLFFQPIEHAIPQSQRDKLMTIDSVNHEIILPPDQLPASEQLLSLQKERKYLLRQINSLFHKLKTNKTATRELYNKQPRRLFFWHQPIRIVKSIDSLNEISDSLHIEKTIPHKKESFFKRLFHKKKH